MILDQVIKELSLVRVGGARKALMSAAHDLVLLLCPIYFELQSDLILQALQAQDKSFGLLKARLENSWASGRVIRKLIASLMERPRDDIAARSFWDASLVTFKDILPLSISANLTNIDQTVGRLLAKDLSQVTKLHVNLAKNLPTDFALLQAPDFEVVQLHWWILSLLGQHYAAQAGYPPVAQVTQSVHDFDDGQKSLIDKLGHHALLLLRACMKMIFTPGRALRYRPPEEKDIDNRTMANLKEHVFTETSILELLNHIVMELFLFQPSDLREWEEEPDEWEKREELESEDFEFAVRPAAEKLLLDLAINFKELTTKRLLEMLTMATCTFTECCFFELQILTEFSSRILCGAAERCNIRSNRYSCIDDSH
jgi:hypothetical protein